MFTNFCGITLARRYVATKQEDTKRDRGVVMALLIVYALMIAGVVGFASAGQFALALAAFFLLTVAAGPRRSLEQVWLNQQLDSDVRATMFSLQSQVSSIAQIIGGPLLGLLATGVSVQAALLAAGVILSFTLIVYAHNLTGR